MKGKFLVLRAVLTTAFISCVGCLSGCGWFGGDDEENSQATYAFSVKYGEETLNYTFKNKADIKIDPRYKDGYVLSGFYTQQNGQGDMLIDWKGLCISSSFSGDGSTVLYPFYEDIDYNYVFKNQWYATEAKTAGYNVYKSPSIFYSSVNNFEDYEYLVRVATCNPNMQFSVEVTAEMQNGGWGEIGMGIAKNVDASNLSIKQSYETTKSYSVYSLTGSIGAESIAIADANIMIGFTCHGFMRNLNYKNVRLTIGIINDNSEIDEGEEA